MSDVKNPIVTITMENGAVMTGELYPAKAPNTVANFISLANKGFYDGLIFHRVIPGFMIQGGCPDGNGMGGPGYDIRGEFSGNGFAQNDLKHTTGVLSMARAMHPDSAGSQFFIMVAPAPHLDGQYAAFGQVTGNVEEAIRIAAENEAGGRLRAQAPAAAPEAGAAADSENARLARMTETVTQYIRENYMYDISMQELARNMNYSEPYFCKLFKQCFNKNFTSYLTEYRVEEAKKLLSLGTMTVKEVGKAVGYSDANYFTKVFKRITGQNPSENRLCTSQKS